MSQSVPPQTGGQEEGPNPLEVFYEKNKKWLIALAVALVAGTGLKYGIDELNASKRNSEWSEFNATTGLGSTYATKIDLQEMSGQNKQFQNQELLYQDQSQLDIDQKLISYKPHQML